MAQITLPPIQRTEIRTASPDALTILESYRTLPVPPRLGETALHTVLDFFEEQDLTSLKGYSASAETNATQEMLRHCLPRGARELPTGAFVGPYVLGNLYYPRAVSIWTPRTPAVQLTDQLS